MRRRARKKKWIQKALKVGRHRYGRGRHHKKSIRVGPKHKGMLHRHYGLSEGEKIPYRWLVRDKHQKGTLGQRVRFALNMRRAAARRRRRRR